MTITEKANELQEFCDTQRSCCECPLKDGECNWEEGDGDNTIEADYNTVFPVETPQEEDVVNHPSHYTQGGMECIDEMVLVFGIEATMNFCLLNTWKYRKRAPFKGKLEEDMKKSDWYLAKYKELEDRWRGRKEDF